MLFRIGGFQERRRDMLSVKEQLMMRVVLCFIDGTQIMAYGLKKQFFGRVDIRKLRRVY